MMAAMEQRMRAMHEKMAAAKTPQERQALMAEHMKTMQDGMRMMKSMHGQWHRQPSTRRYGWHAARPADDGKAHGHDGVDDADDDGSNVHAANLHSRHKVRGRHDP